MAQIIYQHDPAILSFDYEDVKDSLTDQIRENNVEDDLALLNWLQNNSQSGHHDLTIKAEDEFQLDEYVSRIVFVIRDLLLNGKGNVYCKRCERDIPATDITKDQISPLDAHKGIDKKTIKGIKKDLGIKGHLRIPGSGGTTFLCDRGHELFATRDWTI